MGDGRVLVIGDWDADGVVSSAILVFTQEKAGAFPIRTRTPVDAEPAGPRSIAELTGRIVGCWDYVFILDIPYTPEVEKFISEYISRGCDSRFYYFDHHPATEDASKRLEEEYNMVVVTGRSATSVILMKFVEGLGVKLAPRLRLYAAAVAHLEGGRRGLAVEVDDKLVSLVASISKTLNILRNREVWLKYVRWLASPLPLEPPKIKLSGDKEELLRKGMELSREADEEVKRIATQLAVTASSLGYAKLVDARGKWKRRGASALASWLYKIIGQTVVLIVERHDGVPLMIIRSSGGIARRAAEKLYAAGLVEDVGGHGNLAISRLPSDFSLSRLKEEVRKAILAAHREQSGPLI